MSDSIEVHCRVMLTFVKDGEQVTYNTSFRSDFLGNRPLGMAFLYCSENLDGLFEFILGKLEKLLPEKEVYVVEDAVRCKEEEDE